MTVPGIRTRALGGAGSGFPRGDASVSTANGPTQLASNWPVLLLNGVVLIVAGVLIFSIDWTIRE